MGRSGDEKQSKHPPVMESGAWAKQRAPVPFSPSVSVISSGSLRRVKEAKSEKE